MHGFFFFCLHGFLFIKLVICMQKTISLYQTLFERIEIIHWMRTQASKVLSYDKNKLWIFTLGNIASFSPKFTLSKTWLFQHGVMNVIRPKQYKNRKFAFSAIEFPLGWKFISNDNKNKFRSIRVIWSW